MTDSSARDNPTYPDAESTTTADDLALITPFASVDAAERWLRLAAGTTIVNRAFDSSGTPQ